MFDHSLSYAAREKLLSWRFLSPIDYDRFAIFQPAEYQPVSGLTFVAYGSHNFFHWHFNHLWLVPYIPEQLPRWGLAELNVAFLLDGLSAWQSECLDLLGVPPQNVLLLKRRDVADCAFRFDIAIFPEVPEDGHPAAAAYLRCTLVAEVRRQGIGGRGPRIFISRTDARSRRIANEDEVFERLRPLNFVKIAPSHLPYAEQLACFADAAVIIGPHGAGLTSMFAAKHGAILIELFPQEFIHPYYFRLCKSIGGRYNYLISERPSVNAVGDFVIDPQAVSEIATAMIRANDG